MLNLFKNFFSSPPLHTLLFLHTVLLMYDFWKSLAELALRTVHKFLCALS